MQLKITSVKARGDQTKEAVWLKVLEDCNLRDYMIADKTYDADGESNLHRHTYWFAEKAVRKGDRIVLYTKRGVNRLAETTSDEPAHLFYWNLKAAVWNDDGDGAVLVRIAGFRKSVVKPA